MAKFLLPYHLKLQSLINSVNHAEDIIDKIVGTYTPSVILCLTVLFTMKSTFFVQIECWCPYQWTRNWERYAENICWITENYFNSSHRIIGQISKADAIKLSSTKSINYCAWVPFILIIISYLLRLPEMVWITITNLHNIDLNNFLRELVRLSNEDRSIAVDYAVGNFIFDWNIKNKRLKLFICYLIFKILNINIIILNLYIIQYFFGDSETVFGFTLIYRSINKVQWKESLVFPRIIQCIIWRHEEDHVVPHVVTCVFSLNAIYEKTVLIIFIWLLVVLILSIISFLYWSIKLLIPRMRFIMVRNVIEILKDDSKKEGIRYFLNRERCFIFLLISINIDHIFQMEILSKLLSDNSIVESNKVL